MIIISAEESIETGRELKQVRGCDVEHKTLNRAREGS